MISLKPIDKKVVLDSAKNTKAVFTIEDHSIIGGLGSAVSEVLAESDYKVVFHRFGFPDAFVKLLGDREYLTDQLGLSESNIEKIILEKINE